MLLIAITLKLNILMDFDDNKLNMDRCHNFFVNYSWML